MPENNAEMSKEPKPQDTSVGIDKSAAETPTAQAATETPTALKAHDEPSATPGKVAPSAASPAKAETDSPVSSKRSSRFKKIVPAVVLLLAAGILFGIMGGWNRWVGSGSQKTDDAYLRADITPLSTRVSGTVAQVAVADYQRVKAGDLLVQLKDDDFKAQVAQAEAGVAAALAALENNAKQKELQSSRIMQAQAGLQGAGAQIAQAGAAIEAAQADVANADAGVDG